MRNLVLIVLLLFMPFWCGCVRYNYTQYQVKVVDAEDKVPVEGAKVSTGYMIKGPAPPSSRAITNQSGMAELKVANGFHWGVSVSAEGYIPVGYFPYRGDMSFLQNLIVKNDGEVIVSIFKKPEPKIEIVIPDGYRGPVSLEIKRTDKLIQGKPGQRVFSYKMKSNGTVTAQVSPLFYDMLLDSIFTVRYENGNAIPDNFVGFRWVNRNGFKGRLFVGTDNHIIDWLQKRTNQNNGTKEEDVQLIRVRPTGAAVRKIR